MNETPEDAKVFAQDPWRWWYDGLGNCIREGKKFTGTPRLDPIPLTKQGAADKAKQAASDDKGKDRDIVLIERSQMYLENDA